MTTSMPVQITRILPWAITGGVANYLLDLRIDFLRADAISIGYCIDAPEYCVAGSTACTEFEGTLHIYGTFVDCRGERDWGRLEIALYTGGC
jgi:hypothetical protein